VIYITNFEAELSEFEKSTWSFIASGVSLSLLYFLYVVWMGIVTGRFDLVRSLDVGWVDVVVIYPVLLCVAVFVGYVSGTVLRLTLGTPTAPQSGTTQ
jgi:ABC-type uncharacterized transport system permease subunit